MEVGFLTNIFGTRSITEICGWAEENGFGCVEIGSATPLDEKEFKEAMDETGVRVHGFAYCRNFLSASKQERKEYYDNLVARIELASSLGVKYVTTSTGKDESQSFEANIPLVVEFFEPLIEKAASKGVTIAFENCPGLGNIAISPYLWREILKRHPSFDLKLVYDPAHFIWQGIDPYDALREFSDRIVYVHAKDTEILRDDLKDKGILLGDHCGHNVWWKVRLPGWGVIDWNRIMILLMESGFDGVLSIEHEDYSAWAGSDEKKKRALLMTKKYLEDIMP